MNGKTSVSVCREETRASVSYFTYSSLSFTALFVLYPSIVTLLRGLTQSKDATIDYKFVYVAAFSSGNRCESVHKPSVLTKFSSLFLNILVISPSLSSSPLSLIMNRVVTRILPP